MAKLLAEPISLAYSQHQLQQLTVQTSSDCLVKVCLDCSLDRQLAMHVWHVYCMSLCSASYSFNGCICGSDVRSDFAT